MKVLINGISGQMGQAVLRLPQTDFEVVGGVDVVESKSAVPTFTSVEAIDVDFDVAIDVSVAKAALTMLDYCIKHEKPIVICTTGFDEDGLARIQRAAETIPIFRSSNMSLGVNLQAAICRTIAEFLGGSADIEIVEKHHNKKADAPSGTALMLFESIDGAMDCPHEKKFGRGPKDGRRQKNEIGLHSVRGGTVVGEHEVMFLMDDEAITVTHQAFSRRVFAIGAVRAAAFLTEQAAGLYSMDDLIGRR
ncbi:MAG: 4-hydroxy-tetrahydrodipicolinate reductase [Clostridia bacterium]|nr:4-hydroxy-tetrahydrodipicolinate reductase [Clostridia bacterium]